MVLCLDSKKVLAAGNSFETLRGFLAKEENRTVLETSVQFGLVAGSSIWVPFGFYPIFLGHLFFAFSMSIILTVRGYKPF